MKFQDLANIVICGTNSGSVHTWNADTNEMIATSAKHFSQVSDVKALPSTKTFVSAGRDKTMIFWSWNLQPLKVIPTFEEIETIQLLPGFKSNMCNDHDKHRSLHHIGLLSKPLNNYSSLKSKN